MINDTFQALRSEILRQSIDAAPRLLPRISNHSDPSSLYVDMARLFADVYSPIGGGGRPSRSVERTGPPCAACGEKLPSDCVSDDFCDPVCQRAWAQGQTDGYRPTDADAARVHSCDDTDTPELRESSTSGAVQHGGTLEDLATQTVDGIARAVNSQWIVELWRNSGDTLRFRVSCDHDDCDWLHDHDHEGRLTDRDESERIRSAVLNKVREHGTTHGRLNLGDTVNHTWTAYGDNFSYSRSAFSSMLRGMSVTSIALDEPADREETPEETEAWNAACVGDGKRGSTRRRPAPPDGPTCRRPVLDGITGHALTCSRRRRHSGQHVACGMTSVLAVADNNESETT